MKRLLAALLILCSVCCRKPDGDSLPPGPRDPVKNLLQLDSFTSRVQAEATDAAWQLAVDPGACPKPKPYGIAPLQLVTEAELRALNDRLEDPEQRRCLEAIRFLCFRMQSDSDRATSTMIREITKARSAFPDLNQIFIQEPDAAIREKEWRSLGDAANQLDPILRRLVMARTDWAWSHGWKDYLTVAMERRGYDVSPAQRIETTIKRSLGPPKNLQAPWDFESFDPALAARMSRYFDETSNLSRASFVFTLLGLPANPPGVRLQQPVLTSFSVFAFYGVNPPRDVRITYTPGAGIAPHWSAFHEFGHVAMALLTPISKYKSLQRPFSPAVSEGCAKVAERLFYSPEWLTIQKLPAEDIAALRNWERSSEIARMRSILADLEFERVLYEGSDDDLESEYVRIQKDVAGVKVPDEFPGWTLKRHLAYEPGARMDYLLARCAQAAIYRRLRALKGGLLGEESQRVLREEVFGDAARLSFEEWFRRAAHTEVSCNAWLQDVVSIAPQ